MVPELHTNEMVYCVPAVIGNSGIEKSTQEDPPTEKGLLYKAVPEVPCPL